MALRFSAITSVLLALVVPGLAAKAPTKASSTSYPVVQCDLKAWKGFKLAVLQYHTDAQVIKEESLPGTSELAVTLTDLSTAYWSEYCRRHGFKYIRAHITATQIGKYQNAFIMRTGLIMKYLPHYDAVLVIDTDLIINNPEQNMLCLYEHWGFTRNGAAAVMLPLDPDAPQNYFLDMNNESSIMANVGFMTFRNSDKGRAVAKNWNNLVLTKPEWYWNWPREQAVWHIFVKPTLKEGVDIITLPCDEANGYAWMNTNPNVIQCAAKHITHAWLDKMGIRRYLSQWFVHHFIRGALSNIDVDPILQNDPTLTSF